MLYKDYTTKILDMEHMKVKGSVSITSGRNQAQGSMG